MTENTQTDASQIVREIRAGLEGVTLEDWQPMTVDPDRIAILLNAFDAQTREIAELREALKPFAKAAIVMDLEHPAEADSSLYAKVGPMVYRYVDLLHGDFRRARSTLRAKEKSNG